MPSRRKHSIAGLCALLSLLRLSRAASQSVLTDATSNAAAYVCQHPPYEVHLVSSSPLVVYLAGFVTPDECAHLTEAAHDTFAQSAVADREKADGRVVLDKVRTSQSTNVPRDHIVRCIEERALRFQGFLDGPSSLTTSSASSSSSRLEPLQLVKYGRGEHYHYHTDWFTDPVHATAAQGGNRVSSFFAYVHVSNGTTHGGPGPAALRGGGTNFPLVNAPPPTDQWCAYTDCDEPWERGVTFRPVQGNAVYWDNLLPRTEGQDTRTGDPRALHAGLPVVAGEKIGMNIWTREGTVPAAIRGEEDR
ncbi:hypothetical protein HMPREF1624_01277 [Sporothrix schenckii ATCC 58251]|uniref:Prolyl 4-hydroxylase alpha subunit domain-containing protein n=1 Tax=Sporothrix schenckii (strain ATCC 58251 / de Perez 2211183) TaxID=1391915 RepID=U7Q580_SPOS1|nr:hypothetical protein HMPREF1624_01277 [Sporothrix schenckii ATCC 58251]